MTRIPRRILLASISAVALAACTPAQQDATLAKIKDMSQALTDLAVKYGSAFAPAEVAIIVSNNTAIQALVPGAWVATAQALIGGTVRVLLALLPRLLPLLPPGMGDALNVVLAFLAGFAGMARAAPGERVPTIDEAAGAAASLRGR